MTKEKNSEYVYLVSVAGASSSGKTTIVNKLANIVKKNNHYDNVSFLRLDDYYKDLTHLPMEKRKLVNFDHPNSLDFDLLISHIESLVIKKEAIYHPVYDFKVHNRVKGKTVKVNPAKVIILEGILLFTSEKIRNLSNLKIFVDTELDVCLSRRIRRDISERGRNVEDVLAQYENYTKPMFEQFIFPTKKFADIIIPRGGLNDTAIKILYEGFSSIF